MRVMLDTNIFISMIFFPSERTRELARRLTSNHQIVVCDYVVEELQLVTDRKFPAKRKFLDRFFLELPFELVYTPKELDLIESAGFRSGGGIRRSGSSGRRDNAASGHNGG